MNFDDPCEYARTIAPLRGTSERPWLAREEILIALDEELCLYDKARLQRIEESEAKGTGLCWLAAYISRIHVRHNTNGSFSWPKYANNPNLPKKKIEECTRCDNIQKECYVPAYYRPATLVIGCELAVSFWESIRRQPLIEIPEPPPLFPDSKNDSWFVFEKDGLDYYNMVILPQAMRHIEWEGKYCGLSFSAFLNRYKEEIWDWWIASGENNGWYAKFAKNGDWKWAHKEEEAGWKITIVQEDGQRKALPGVYYPGQSVDWRLKRNAEWSIISTRLEWWFNIGEQTHWGSPERRARYTRWREAIDKYLEGKGPEPTEDIDLAKDLPSKEDEFIAKCIHAVCHSFVGGEQKAPLVWETDDEEPNC